MFDETAGLPVLKWTDKSAVVFGHNQLMSHLVKTRALLASWKSAPAGRLAIPVRIFVCDATVF
jgi:hypothetical protein